MSDKYTKMLEDIRSSYPPSNFDRVTYPGLAWDRIITIEGFDRWLSVHDAATRTAALEEAAVIAESEVLRQTYSVKKDIATAIRAAKEESE